MRRNGAREAKPSQGGPKGSLSPIQLPPTPKNSLLVTSIQEEERKLIVRMLSL